MIENNTEPFSMLQLRSFHKPRPNDAARWRQIHQIQKKRTDGGPLTDHELFRFKLLCERRDASSCGCLSWDDMLEFETMLLVAEKHGLIEMNCGISRAAFLCGDWPQKFIKPLYWIDPDV